MKRILFLCTGNACRSQIAEGFAKKILPESEVEVFSAGIDPKGLHPIAIKVMQEIGIDISSQRSKSLLEIPLDVIDIVVTLCEDAAQCPVLHGKAERVHWPIEDPAKAMGSEKEITDIFRRVRDKIILCVNDVFKMLK